MNWSWLFTNLAAAPLLPPLNLLLTGLVGVFMLKRRKALGTFLILTGLSGLFLLSMPVVGNHLLAHFETPPLPPGARADAIVVLGGGITHNAPEFGGDTLSRFTLERVRYAARLHRQTGAPILVSGGAPDEGTPEGQVMRQVLVEDFNVPVRWVEDRSDNTRDNARLTAEQLKADGITRIFLVSQAWHLARAQRAFEQTGLDVLPAGTGYVNTRAPRPLDFVPHWKGLMHSSLAFHEGIGQVWYAIRN